MIFNESIYNKDWPIKKLSQLGDFSRGVSKHRPRDDARLFIDGDIPFLQTGEVKSARLYVDSYSAKYNDFGLSQSKLWHKGTLCITIAANIAESAILSRDMCFPDSIVGFVPNDNETTSEYMYYIFEYIKSQIQSRTNGSIQDNINIDYLKDLEFRISPNQEKIKKVLSDIDNKILLNQAIIGKLESMAKTLYDYWFVQFDFPDANGRPYKTSGGKMEWNETLSREIPKGWESDLAGALIKNITNGLNPRKNFKLNVGGNIDYLTVKNLTKSGLIDWSNCDKITDDDKKIVSKRSDLRRGDILLASISPLGRCYYITETPSTWDINESVFSVRPNSEKCTSEYLYSFLTSELFIKQLENNSTGSIFKGIRVEALKLMPIVVPPIKVIERYSRIVKKYYYAKEKLANENIRLAQLRDYLLPMLMNGQVTFRQ